MNVSLTNSTAITVQWSEVDCIHRNGDITGYSVRYRVAGSVSAQTVLVLGGSTMETIITSLILSNTTLKLQPLMLVVWEYIVMPS